jgi:hypothetical protein
VAAKAAKALLLVLLPLNIWILKYTGTLLLVLLVLLIGILKS